MGSGQGKARRAKAPIIAAQGQATYQKSPWDEFLRDNELMSVGVAQYYLGYRPQVPTKVEYNKVLNEIFADLVAVGAIVLPGSYLAKDFRFALASPWQTPKNKKPRLQPVDIYLKGNLQVGAHVLSGLVDLGVPLSSVPINLLLIQMQHGMNSVFI